jgi:hypothetical protein
MHKLLTVKDLAELFQKHDNTLRKIPYRMVSLSG